MSSSHDELRGRVAGALSEVTLAEQNLEKALRALGTGGLRSEKVTVTTNVSDAFSRLRSAHAELTRLRDILDRE